MFQAVIEGNYFEQNAGAAQMTFGNAPDTVGNYIVRLENNYYHMGGAPGLNTPTKYVFAVERDGLHRSFPGQTQVFLGYEAGSFFSDTAELTDDEVFKSCYLFVTSAPRAFHLINYHGQQTLGNPKWRCDIFCVNCLVA